MLPRSSRLCSCRSISAGSSCTNRVGGDVYHHGDVGIVIPPQPSTWVDPEAAVLNMIPERRLGHGDRSLEGRASVAAGESQNVSGLYVVAFDAPVADPREPKPVSRRDGDTRAPLPATLSIGRLRARIKDGRQWSARWLPARDSRDGIRSRLCVQQGQRRKQQGGEEREGGFHGLYVPTIGPECGSLSVCLK